MKAVNYFVFTAFLFTTKLWAADCQYAQWNSQDYNKYYQSQNRENCLKEWTVLVFMAADNDLGEYALEDLYEMEAGFQSGTYAGSTAKTDLVVEYDGPGIGKIERRHIFQSQKIFSINDIKNKKIQIQSPIVKEFDELKAGSVATRLKDFLSWAVETYPSKNYIVVIWGHGQGWGLNASSQAADGRSTLRDGGVLFDDAPIADALGLPELNKILKTVSESKLKKLWDMVVFDACLMQTIEVISEISEVTRYVLGSTQIQNFRGLPYRRWLYTLNTGSYGPINRDERERFCGDDRVCWQAYSLPRLVQATWREGGLQNELDILAQKNFTFSSFISSQFQNDLLPSMQLAFEKLNQYLKAKSDRRIGFLSAIHGAPRFQGGAIELGHFFARIEEQVRRQGLLEHKSEYFFVDVLKAISKVQQSLIFANLNYYYGTNYISESRYPLGSGTRVLSIWLPFKPTDFEYKFQDLKSQSVFYQDVPAFSQFLQLVFLSN